MSDNGPLAKVYKVLIVDDHPIVRWGLRELVAAEPDLEVCGEAETLPEALTLVDDAEPDIVVVDLTLKDGHGLDLVQKIKAVSKTKMLVSSMHDESLFAERCTIEHAVLFLCAIEDNIGFGQNASFVGLSAGFDGCSPVPRRNSNR